MVEVIKNTKTRLVCPYNQVYICIRIQMIASRSDNLTNRLTSLLPPLLLAICLHVLPAVQLRKI
jgi:hypothetical protein